MREPGKLVRQTPPGEFDHTKAPGMAPYMQSQHLAQPLNPAQGALIFQQQMEGLQGRLDTHTEAMDKQTAALANLHDVLAREYQRAEIAQYAAPQMPVYPQHYGMPQVQQPPIHVHISPSFHNDVQARSDSRSESDGGEYRGNIVWFLVFFFFTCIAAGLMGGISND